MSIKSVFAILC